MSKEMMATCREWVASGKSVTIRLSQNETCVFLRKEERQQKGPTTKSVSSESKSGNKKSKVEEHTVITTVTDYYHHETIHTKLEVFKGADPTAQVCIKYVVNDHPCMFFFFYGKMVYTYTYIHKYIDI